MLASRPEIRCDGHFGTLHVVIVTEDGTEIELPVLEATVAGSVGEVVTANLTMAVRSVDLKDLVNDARIVARGRGVSPAASPDVTIWRRSRDFSAMCQGFSYHVCPGTQLARMTLFRTKKRSSQRRWRMSLRRIIRR